MLRGVKSLKVSSIRYEDYRKHCPVFESCSIHEYARLIDDHPYGEFSLDVIDQIAADVKLVHIRPIWKGAYYAYIEYKNNDIVPIRISFYGAFFEIMEDETCFQFDSGNKSYDLWNEEVRKIINQFPSNKPKSSNKFDALFSR